MANGNYSSYMAVGHLGSRSLCHHLRSFSVKLWWLIIAPRTARGCRADRATAFASRDCEWMCHLATAVTTQVWGCKHAVTYLLLFWDQRPLSCGPWPIPSRYYLGVSCWRRLGEEERGGSGAQELKSNLEKDSLHPSSTLIFVNLHKWKKENGNNLFTSIAQSFTITKIKYFRHHCIKIAHDTSSVFHQLQEKLWARRDMCGVWGFFRLHIKDCWE